MTKFEEALEYVLQKEGGLNENTDGKDLGGITNRGISFKFLKSLSQEKLRQYGLHDIPEEDDIRNLTMEQTRAIYKGEFWDQARFDDIHPPKIINYLFDSVVSMGLSPAIKAFQRAINSSNLFQNLKEDGILGDRTIKIANFLDLESYDLLAYLKLERIAHYISIVEKNPSQKGFLFGWIKRAL